MQSTGWVPRFFVTPICLQLLQIELLNLPRVQTVVQNGRYRTVEVLLPGYFQIIPQSTTLKNNDDHKQHVKNNCTPSTNEYRFVLNFVFCGRHDTVIEYQQSISIWIAISEFLKRNTKIQQIQSKQRDLPVPFWNS